jgi:putative transposase
MEYGLTVPLAKFCRWFEVLRRPVHYGPTKAKPTAQERFANPIQQMIESEPSFGYQTVANLIRFKKNTVQRVLRPMGWKVRERAISQRALHSEI